MAEDRSKKTLVVSVLAFLMVGGAVSLVFINQGVGDLTGSNSAGFSYGNAVRNAVMPVFSYLGVGDPEAELASKASAGRPPEPDPMLNDLSIPAEPSFGGASASASFGGSGSRGGYSGPPSRIPRMGGGTSGLGSMGGGGSKSSAQMSDATPSGANKNFKVSGVVGSGGKGEPGKGTLSALKNANTNLTEALRGSSALGAKSKWDQSFGGASAGSGGPGGKTSAYGGSLAKLDGIKSGEIGNLKMMNQRGGDVPTPTSSTRDVAAEKAINQTSDPSKDNMARDLSQQAAQSATSAIGQGLTASQNNNGGNNGGQAGAGPLANEKDGSGAAVTPPANVQSFIDDYGEPRSVEFQSGPNPACADFGMEGCPNGFWRVQYEDGKYGSFGLTGDVSSDGTNIPIVFDQCLASCGCSESQPPCGQSAPCNPPSCV